MATIEIRGPYQFRARVRRKGISKTQTFETRAEAEAWARVMEGRITGDEYVDRTAVRDTTVSQACAWFLDQIAPMGPGGKRIPKSDHARNQASKLKFWMESEFADWSLAALKPWDLIEWRNELLAEEACSAQTIVHRLNTLSQTYKSWALAHKVTLECPVGEKVRPPLGRGRERRLDPRPDESGRTEEERLLEAVGRSSRPWLRPAVIIAIESCMRQSELAHLTVRQLRLEGDRPHADLSKTKNTWPRRVPLSRRAVAAFRELVTGNEPRGQRVFPVETSRAFGHAWRDAVSEDRFPDLNWHDLRHEAISRLFEETDLRDREIMSITGHLSPEMLNRYAHLRSDRLASRLPGA